MRSKTLVVLIAVAVMSVSSIAMARSGSGGGSGGKGGSRHFAHGHFMHRFQNNQLFNSWGWGWGLGWPYDEGGYTNTTVAVFPQATPKAAETTGSIAAAPCHWNAEAFTVPSSAGGTRQVQVVGCR